MIRTGDYCIYHGKEYDITEDMQGNTIIYTKNKSFTDETFSFDNLAGAYRKIIDPKEIQEAYRIRTRAIIDGDELSIDNEPGGEEGMYWIVTCSKELKKKYNMKEFDRGVYGTWIEEDKVQVVERKEIVDYYK